MRLSAHVSSFIIASLFPTLAFGEENLAPTAGAPATVTPTGTPATTPLTTSAAKSTDVKSDEKKVSVDGAIQVNSNLLSSTNGKGFYTSAAIAEVYFKYEQSMVYSNLDIRFLGNDLAEYAKIPTPENNAKEKSVKVLTSTRSHAAVIRKAQVGIKLPYDLQLELGRIRPGYRSSWGVDATQVPGSYGHTDGARLIWNGGFSGLSTQAAATCGKIQYLGLSDNPKANAEALWGNSLSSSKGCILNLGVKAFDDKLELKTYYGFENNMIVELDRSADKVTTTTKANNEPKNVLDASHFEVSLGYNFENIGFGAWYEFTKAGNKRPVTGGIESGVLEFGPKMAYRLNTQFIGVGVNGTSALFGVTDVLYKGGLMTFGSAYEMHKDFENKNDPEKNKNYFSAGVGYTLNGYVLELDYALENAYKTIYANSKGVENKAKSSQTLYLAAIASF